VRLRIVKLLLLREFKVAMYLDFVF